MVLYSQALTGASITDVASNLASLNAILGTGQAAEQDAMAAVDEATLLQQRLTDVADERAQLVTQVRTLSDEAAALANEQADLLANMDATIKQLARKLAREREAAAAAATAAITSSTNAPDVVTTADSGPYAEAAIDAALSKLGSPYVWGEEGPDTFDCSGLVLWSYAQAGLALPRLASDQYFASTPVSVNAMAPGDLLVYAYDTNNEETIHHITMYIGNGQMVHAPRTGDVVKVVPVYYDGLYGVARPGI
jgi:cell wall-associated NlpC family hydrolase